MIHSQSVFSAAGNWPDRTRVAMLVKFLMGAESIRQVVQWSNRQIENRSTV
jgi:hypothetical protein